MSFSKLSQTIRYRGPRFNVYRGQFRHDDGEVVTREWVDPGDVVAVLPFDGHWFWLGRQPREVIGAVELGLCAGKIDPGEAPLTAAARELREEFGINASSWTKWGEFYSSEGITTEKCHLFLARGLTTDAEKWIDPSERIDMEKVAISRLEDTLAGLTNAKAIIALLKLREYTKLY